MFWLIIVRNKCDDIKLEFSKIIFCREKFLKSKCNNFYIIKITNTIFDFHYNFLKTLELTKI